MKILKTSIMKKGHRTVKGMILNRIGQRAKKEERQRITKIIKEALKTNSGPGPWRRILNA